MRQILAVLVALVVLGGVLYLVARSRRAGMVDRELARLEHGATGPGEARGRIDPHAPSPADKASSPLRLMARLLGTGPRSAQLEIEVAATELLPDVRVVAQRFDVGATLEPSHTDSLWQGALQPGTPRRLQADVAFGAQAPARIVVTARTHGGPSAARFGASDVVDLRPAPGSEPTPSGGFVSYPGRPDSSR